MRTSSLLVFTALLGITSSAPLRASTIESVVGRFGVGEDVYVRSLAVEPDAKRLWVGTSSGVNEIDLRDESLVRSFTRDDGLANEYIFAIGVDSHGYKWFGTNAGGVSRYKDGQMKTYFPLHGLADYWIYAFAEQNNGPFWIGTWAGANSFDLHSETFKTYIEQLINEWVYAIDVDSQDRVWFGTEGGVTMLDGRKWEHWTVDDGLSAPNDDQLPQSPNAGLGTKSRHDLNILVNDQKTYNPNYVFSLHVDAEDVVWVGTWGGGVSRFDGEKWDYLTTRDGLAGDIVYSIAESDDGILWFGTDEGLSRYDRESGFSNYGKDDGLFDKHVYAIATDQSNNVWVGTRHGVVRLAVSSNQ